MKHVILTRGKIRKGDQTEATLGQNSGNRYQFLTFPEFSAMLYTSSILKKSAQTRYFAKIERPVIVIVVIVSSNALYVRGYVGEFHCVNDFACHHIFL